MGDKTALQYVLRRVEAEEDEVIQVATLLQDVAYTRQPEAIKLLENYLFSQKRMPPLYEGDEGTLFSQYAMNALAQMLEDFPLPVKFAYTPEEIQLAKNWMRSSGSHKIKK